MLERAASNAYSWWWASHIRTKQSKWLEQNLQDMEEKVQNVLKLIEEDGDSFAKRAEMYYKKRPELIVFVEDTYRAYRALAERYNHLSTELQNANNTIATVFPEKLQFAMEEECDFSPKSRHPDQESSRLNTPRVPKAPGKDFTSLMGLSMKNLENKKKQAKKSAATTAAPALKSGLTKGDALERIDKVQKEILPLQTVKEFSKCSYKGGLARYCEIENQITVMQAEVSALQDEFGEGMVVEDDEARRLMSVPALRTWQETLSQLQEKHRKSAEEAQSEQVRMKNSLHRFKSLKKEILPGESDGDAIEFSIETEMSQEDGEVRQREHETGAVKEKIKQRMDVEFSDTSLTASKMVEKIDELAEKVIGFEMALASQTALMGRLRAENTQLQAQIQALEDKKGSLVSETEGTMAHDKMKEMEERLHGICELNKSIHDQSNHMQIHFAEAHFNLERLFKKLSCIKPDEEEIPSTPMEGAADSTGPRLQVAKGQENEKHSPDEMSEQKQGDLDKETEASRKSLMNSTTLSEVRASVPMEAVDDLAEVNLLLAKEGREEKHNPDDMSGKSPREQKHGSLNEETEDSGESLKNSMTMSELMPHEEPLRALHSEEGSRDENEQTGEEQVLDALSLSECNTCHCQSREDLHDSSKRSDPSQVEDRGDGIAQEEPNWRELFLKGMENREKTLLAEYTTVLRNYKEMKKKLSEMERKDEEIHSLRQKVGLLQTILDEYKDPKEPDTSDVAGFPDIQLPDDLGNLDTTSEIEQKLRMDIDQLLEENLEFWLRFSSTLHQIQKYKNAIEDIQAEVRKLEEKEKNWEGGDLHATQSSFRSEARPIYKRLKAIGNELTIWSEKCSHLKDEQQSRFSSLCHMQEEITGVLKASAEDDDFRFTSYQAAKFQGEVQNMKQENNKVAIELRSGLDHVALLQVEVDRTLAKINEKLGLPGSKNYRRAQLKQAISRTRIPLRSFIFGTKQKKQREAVYRGMNPIVHSREHYTKAGQSVESSQRH